MRERLNTNGSQCLWCGSRRFQPELEEQMKNRIPGRSDPSPWSGGDGPWLDFRHTIIGQGTGSRHHRRTDDQPRKRFGIGKIDFVIGMEDGEGER